MKLRIPTKRYSFLEWCNNCHQAVRNTKWQHKTECLDMRKATKSQLDCKCYSSLPLGAVVSLFCLSV